MERKYTDSQYKGFMTRANTAIVDGTTWTAFCKEEELTATQMRTVLYNASQIIGEAIPQWTPKRGVRADKKITVQKKGTVILSKSRLPDDWDVGDRLEIITESDYVVIRKI